MIYSKIKKEEIVNNYTRTVEDLAERVRTTVFMKSHFREDLVDVLKIEINQINDILKSALPKGIVVDYAKIVRVTCFKDVLTFTVRNKEAGSKLQYKYTLTLVNRSDSTNDSLFDECLTTLFNLYETLLITAMGNENITELNTVLDEVVKDAGLDYAVHATVPFGNAGKVISYISDDEVVFVCHEDTLFSIDELTIMQKPSSILSEEDIALARKSLAEVFSTAHTVLEFVQNKGFSLFKFLCKLTSKNPFAYIKDVTNKNIEKQSRTVDCLVYYSKKHINPDADIQNEEDKEKNTQDIFALAEFKNCGIEVILSPFNTKTFERVEGIDITKVAKEVPEKNKTPQHEGLSLK